LPKCPERDVSGLVFYTLRQRFKTARDCIEAVVANQKTTLSDHAANQSEAEAA